MQVATFIAVVLLLCLLLWLKLEGRLLPHKSTRHLWYLSPLPLFKKLQGYIYAARTDWYLKPATWTWLIKRLKNESADSYHGKVLTHSDATKLITINEPLALTNLDYVIPYSMARDIILQDPLPSLAVLECPCRAQKEEACLPRDVCLIVGEPYASFIVDHQPSKARRITVPEALDIIKAENERGHVHTAWFKDVMHNRFYCICNCCSCCCLGMQSYWRGVPRLSHSGYSPSIADDECIGCGECAVICPFQAISLDNEYPLINDQCMGCGLCCSHCPTGAITLVINPDKGIPLDIGQLLQ